MTGLRLFLGADHHRHAPLIDLSDGPPGFPHLETPARLLAMLEGFERLGADIQPVRGVSAETRAAVAALHAPAYLEFLEATCRSIGPLEAVLPTVFGGGGPDAPAPVRAGRFCREIGTPLTQGAFEAALNAAEAVRAAAAAFLEAGGDGVVAAVRPPGHHAGRARYGGYCFVNNAALAAETLENAGRRVAILDVDYHLGDGTAEFASPSRPYASLHADPVANYPYLDPADAAAREGPGRFYETVPPSASVEAIHAGAERLVARLAAARPDCVVLSLGLDLNGADYIQDEELSFRAPDFEGLGARVSALGLPVLTVLEGGYDVATLPDCVTAFMTGFRG